MTCNHAIRLHTALLTVAAALVAAVSACAEVTGSEIEDASKSTPLHAERIDAWPSSNVGCQARRGHWRYGVEVSRNLWLNVERYVYVQNMRNEETWRIMMPRTGLGSYRGQLQRDGRDGLWGIFRFSLNVFANVFADQTHATATYYHEGLSPDGTLWVNDIEGVHCTGPQQ